MIPKKGEIEVTLNNNTTKKKEEINMYDIVDEVDVLRRFPEKWADQVLNTPKWN